MSDNAAPRFRKQLLFPTEHGAWSWLLVPYFTGVLVGVAQDGALNFAVLLVFTGSMSAFLLRQPAAMWMRARRGHGRSRDIPLLKKIIAALSLVAVFSFAGLMALGLTDLLPLILPMVVLAFFYLSVAQQKQSDTRVLWMEIAGSAALALAAPAAMVAANGKLSTAAWAIGGLLAAQNGLGVLYVRQRIAATHQREGNRGLMLGGHTAVLILLVLAAALNWIPPLAVLPTIFFFIRALWAYRTPRPVLHIKKFGFAEVGVEILGGFCAAMAYLL